jgi:hypothetical protein
MYVGVDGVARKVKKAYIGVDGVAREWYSSGKKLSEYGVGDIVLLPENGTNVEYVVVHQGLPNSTYDNSCNGTWLLRKKIYIEKEWHTSKVNDYKNSSIHSYLNNTFFNLFDTLTRSMIKQVKIPYRAGSGASTTVTSGANGLSTKVFLLSACELGFNYDGIPTPYGELEYFSKCATNGAHSKRKAYFGNTLIYWWTRSPYCGSSGTEYVIAVDNTGDTAHLYCNGALGIRPAIVLDSSTNFNPETNAIELEG